jgi:hypothetical protein
MADNEVLVKIMADVAGLKSGIDKMNSNLSSMGNQARETGNHVGKMGDHLFRIFGGMVLMRGMIDMVAKIKEVQDATVLAHAQFQSMFELTLKPGLPFIIKAIDIISKGARGLLGILNMYGAALGTFYGTIFRILSGGNIKQALKDGAANMKAAWDQTVKNFQKSEEAKPKIVKKNNAEIIKHRQELYDRERALADKLVKEEQDRNRENHLAAIQQSNDLNAIERESAQATADFKISQYERIAREIDQQLNDLSAAMVRALNGEAGAWKEWADSVIKEIERVLIKKALLAGLNWLTGGNFIGAVAGLFTGGAKGMAAGGPGGAVNIVIHNLPPGAFAEVVAGSMSYATPGVQARMARAVNKGQTLERVR